MLLALALAVASLTGTAAVLVLVIATRRLAVARLDADVSGHRLLPDAVALTFGESTAGTVRSKRDAAAFALVLARLSQRLSRAARAPITAYFEREGYVDGALWSLSSRRAWRRAAAANALGDMGSVYAVGPLVAALADESRDVRAAAARSLGELGAADAVPALVAALSAGLIPRGVVGQSVLALGAGAVPQLLPLLADGEAGVRAIAAELLGHLGGAGEAAVLSSRLEDTSAPVRRAAAIALGRLGAESAYARLEEALADRVPHVRAAAAEALGVIGNASAFPALLTVARTDAFGPARAAAHAIAHLAPALLQRAAADPAAGPFVREAAETAALRDGAR